MVALAVLTLFFILLAAAGLRGWTVDSRDVQYRLWPLTVAPAANQGHAAPSDWSVR